METIASENSSNGSVRVWFARLVVCLAVATMLAGCLGRGKAQQINCAGRLKQIGLACMMYAGLAVEGGYFPPELALLQEWKYLHDGTVYGCPSLKRPASRAVTSDYVYVGSGLKDTNKSPTVAVLAHDRLENHKGKCVNALFIDGRVMGVPVNEGETIADIAKRQGWILP